MTVLSFPFRAPATLKNTTPDDEGVAEPVMVQYLIVLLQASLINLMVEVPLVIKKLGFVMVRSAPASSPFRLPFIVTLSAPFKSMSGPVKLPLMVRPDIVG